MNFQQHQWVGDNFDKDDQLNHIFFNYKQNRFSFGEVNALAGDHFDPVKNSNPSEVISDSELDAFIKEMFSEDGALCYRSRANFYSPGKGRAIKDFYKDNIISLATIRNKEDYKKMALKTMEMVETKYKKKNIDKDDKWYKVHTGVGHYAKLASHNWHHFLPLCYWVWFWVHKRALNLASEVPAETRKKLKPAGTNTFFILDKKKEMKPEDKFARALFLEACACHYLEDCFAGGHIRTLRIFYGTSLDAINNAGPTHAKDNDAQIQYRNLATKQWCGSTGEQEIKHFFDDGSEIKKDFHLSTVRKCVYTSVLQVFDIPKGDASDNKIRTLSYDVMKYIPQMSSYWLPVKNSIAVKLGYKFKDDQVTDNSCILHVDLGYTDSQLQPPPYKPLPVQIIVAEVTSNGVSDYYFFDLQDDGVYEKQTMFPSVHKDISQGDPVAMQMDFFPCISNDGFDKKYRCFLPEEDLPENELLKELLKKK